MESVERHLNALLAVLLACVLFGAFSIQLFAHEKPCPLCFLQRLGMIGVATGALLNVRFGVRKRHYGFSLISIVFGAFVALRQIALHVCPGFPTFGKPFLGLSLYTWSFFVFAGSLTYIGVLLCVFEQPTSDAQPQRLNGWHYVAFGITFAAAIGNIATTLLDCGLGPCSG